MTSTDPCTPLLPNIHRFHHECKRKFTIHGETDPIISTDNLNDSGVVFCCCGLDKVHTEIVKRRSSLPWYPYLFITACGPTSLWMTITHVIAVLAGIFYGVLYCMRWVSDVLRWWKMSLPCPICKSCVDLERPKHQNSSVERIWRWFRPCLVFNFAIFACIAWLDSRQCR